MRLRWEEVPGTDCGRFFRLTLVRRSNMYNAVGRLFYFGVGTVAGPFHPFGGAVDTIVVQQQDGSFKSSPWYVKFGKFQGVLKRSEKVVNIAVNDEPLTFHMFLDSTGEAYFLKDAEPDKEPFPSSSQLAITSSDELLALEEEASILDNGLEKEPLSSEPAISAGVEVLALESSLKPAVTSGEDVVALESTSELAITSNDEVLPLESTSEFAVTSNNEVLALESSLQPALTSGDEVLASEDEASNSEDGLEIESSSSQLAITFGDEVLAVVDDPSMAEEDGSQFEPSLSQLTITDDPSKVEEELSSEDGKEDVEKGESSEEKDSNLALRFEGRKASYLLVQQAAEAQAAEAHAAQAHAAEEARIAEGRSDETKVAETNDDTKLAEGGSLKENKVRSFLPTSQMLSSMNLKEGNNRITFTFFTRVLGKQQVDARIYLWKWNTRVVISDVDGTITKSDVLGQVMPLMGKDWSQLGVTRLFSAIKENGYEIMFLSARAISQAYLTRQFLVNLKQDGEALPDGPVVISPDGLFPSLYREVIRRAPHEFKIACLQDIRDLFPEDCNPFYAGFGNRDTDEVSYLKVGIPKGKIFIINPKGEVAVNRSIDVKSYTALHKLVDDMFPPQRCNEQEDFNSWNFWKTPLPDIEDELSAKSGSKPKKTK